MKMGMGKAKDGKSGVDSSKYVRYTTEQVEVLEKIYNECPKPSSSRRQQIIKELPILSNIGQKQLKVWFQNRRCREKQRKETGRLQNWNTKLNAMNQLLMEENERLQKLAAQLSTENQYLRQQLQIPHVNTDTNHRPTPPPQVLMATTDTSSESVVTSGQHHKLSPLHLSQDTSILQLITIAEKTLMDFLAKATGNMVEWIQMPGMKPGPDSIGVVAVSRFWGGVAARACSLVDLEPFKVAEIVKHRPHWLEECRRTDVLATFTAENGGMLELVHTQMYAPTTLAPARDLCTLRYTICTEDGSLVICERSLNSTCGVQISPPIPGFSRTSMLPSGYLIRPHDNGGSLVMAVDNLNFELESISGSLNPFYESELVLVQKMTHRVLCYLQSIARELKGGVSVGNHRASSLRGFSRRLIRGFNNAVNGLSEDGWILLSSVRTGPVCVYLNPYPNCRQPGQPDSLNDANPVVGGGIICAKASVLLQGVSPVSFLRFMQEHYTAWTHLGTELCQGAMPKYSSVQVLNPAVGADEVLEVVRLEMSKPSKADNAANGHETFMLQLCSGLGEASAGGCTQMIYAPISASIPDDAPLLPSGFRIFCLDNSKDISCFSQTLDLTSTLEDGVLSGRQSDNHPGLSSCQQQYVLTMAFQFMYEANLHDTVALKAQQHVQGILDFVHTATPMFSSGLVHNKGHFPDVDGFNLVCRIADSYRLHVGVELLTTNGSAEAVVKNFYSLKEAIICCVWKPFPEFLLANCAAMEMLETSPLGLREMSLQRMLTDNTNTDYSKPPSFMHNKGYAHLPAGICVTGKGRGVSFQHAIGWKVLVDDGKMQVAAFMFNNWSFTRAC